MLYEGNIYKVKDLKRGGFSIEKTGLSDKFGKNFRSIFVVSIGEKWHNSVGMLFGLFKRKIVIVKALWKNPEDSK